MTKKYKIRQYEKWRPFITVPEDLRMMKFLKDELEADVEIKETKEFIKLIYLFPKE